MINWVLFTNCISEISNAQTGNGKDINIVIPIYDLREYSDNYSKTSKNLHHYYRDEPYINANDAIADFYAPNNNSALFKLQTKIAGRIENDDTKNVKIRVSLKYLTNFWWTLEMSWIKCENYFILTWSTKYLILDNPIAGQEPTFTITLSSSFDFVNSK